MEPLIQIANQLGIDQTFYSLFALVWVLYFVLSQLYLKPFQKFLHFRKERTEGVKNEAQKLMASAEEKLAQYKARLKEVNDKARETLRQQEETGKKEEAKIVADAVMKSKSALQIVQKELESQKRTAVEALSKDISGLAGDIAEKVLGRPMGAR